MLRVVLSQLSGTAGAETRLQQFDRLCRRQQQSGSNLSSPGVALDRHSDSSTLLGHECPQKRCAARRMGAVGTPVARMGNSPGIGDPLVLTHEGDGGRPLLLRGRLPDARRDAAREDRPVLCRQWTALPPQCCRTEHSDAAPIRRPHNRAQPNATCLPRSRHYSPDSMSHAHPARPRIMRVP